MRSFLYLVLMIFFPNIAVAQNMVLVPSGTFNMGSPTSEPGRYPNETIHPVVLTKSFYISDHEATQGEWQSIMGWNDSSFPGTNRPVEQVTWFDAVDFCNRKAQSEGLGTSYTLSSIVRIGNHITSAVVVWNSNSNGYRLPTEAEWEYACRAGTASACATGDVTNLGCTPIDTNIGQLAWYCGNSGSVTHDVRGKQPNSWGLYDMHGNATEWVWDWYDNYQLSSPIDPAGPPSGTIRQIRGGSCVTSALHARSANRNSGDVSTPGGRNNHLGFRMARTVSSDLGILKILPKSLGTGAALAGVEVEVVRNFQTLTGRSSAQGEALFAVSPGAYGVRAVNSGVAGPYHGVVVVGGSSASLTLLIPTLVPLTGIVVDDFNNLPVPGAKVEFVDGPTTTPVWTDSEGRFAIEAAVAGNRTIKVSMMGRVGSDTSLVALYKEQLQPVSVPGSSVQVRLTTNTVVLLHGFISTSEMWRSGTPTMASALRSSGWAVIDDIDLPGCVLGDWCGLKSVGDQAQTIDPYLGGLPVKSFNIVAHSQGGLVARWYSEILSRATPRVPTLITLGTPHHGTHIAYARELVPVVLGAVFLAAIAHANPILARAAVGGVAWWEAFNRDYPALEGLRPNSQTLVDLNQRGEGNDWPFPTACWWGTPRSEQQLRSTTDYYTLSGRGYLGGTYHLVVQPVMEILTGCPNDGLVPSNSSKLWAFTPNVRNYDVGSAAFHKPQGVAIVGDELPQPPFAQSGSVQGLVIQILAGNPPAQFESADSQEGSGIFGAWATVGEVSRILEPGLTTTDSFLVEAADTLAVTWFWSGAYPAVSLITPTGGVVDSAAAAGEPSIQYTVYPDVNVAELRVAGPSLGTWRFQATNPSVQDTAYVVATVRGSGVTSARLNVEVVGVGQFADRVARLQVTEVDGPALGAVATLQVTHPSAAVQEVILQDDGIYPDEDVDDGIYSGIVDVEPITGATGLAYHVTRSAPDTLDRAGSSFILIGAETDLRIPGTVGVSSPTNSIGGEIEVSALAENAGTEWTMALVKIVETGLGTVLLQDSVGLGPSESISLGGTMMPLEERVYAFEVSVSPLGSIAESDWSNNSMQGVLGPVSGVPEAAGGSDEEQKAIKRPIAIIGVFPIPSRSSVSITWRSVSEDIYTLAVFDLQGRRVRELFSGREDPGTHRTVWDGRDDAGNAAAAGVYFIRASTPSWQEGRKIVMAR